MLRMVNVEDGRVKPLSKKEQEKKVSAKGSAENCGRILDLSNQTNPNKHIGLRPKTKEDQAHEQAIEELQAAAGATNEQIAALHDKLEAAEKPKDKESIQAEIDELNAKIESIWAEVKELEDA